MTKVVVFGASGGIGSQVVAEALVRGLRVRAFARDPSQLPAHEGVEVAQGDVTDPASVLEAVRGVDAVLWALGATRNTSDQVTMFEAGARNLVAAMQEAGVRRLVALSGAGVTVAGERKPLAGRLMSLIVSVAARYVYESKVREWQVFSTSALDWTLIRPPRVLDGGPTGRARVASELGGRSTTQGDVAVAMLDQLTDETYVGAAPFVWTDSAPSGSA